jgi:hypothetical protein
MRRQFRLADAARELVCRLPLSFEMKIATGAKEEEGDR